jgi:alanine-glyoxylate transaminase/serine-glyoxylate transaminase/serine-pyruvate transaminase
MEVCYLGLMSFARLNPPKRLLFGPGPSPVHPRVYEAMSQPIVGHLDPFFFDIVEDIRKLLAEAFGTNNFFTMAISGTGSAGMETCVSNFVEPGSKMAIFANGYFCDRLTDMGKRNGAEVVRFEKPWGETFTDAEAAEFIHREKPNTVAYVHAETSTGAEQKGKAICQAAREADALVIADCVTSLGGMPINIDETGIDIAYSCSQKGLGCPPGLAPITVNERAMERRRKRSSVSPVWYFDLKLLDEYYDGAKRYHHTAPISMFYALREALVVLAEEGLQNRFERHKRNHLAFVAGLEAMGLTMHVEEGRRLWTLNTPRVPQGISDMAVRKRLMDEEGIEIMGGFGPLAGRVFRIGTMGYGSSADNVLLLLGSLESALRAEGFQVRDSGSEAAESLYAATA